MPFLNYLKSQIHVGQAFCLPGRHARSPLFSAASRRKPHEADLRSVDIPFFRLGADRPDGALRISQRDKRRIITWEDIKLSFWAWKREQVDEKPLPRQLSGIALGGMALSLGFGGGRRIG